MGRDSDRSRETGRLLGALPYCRHGARPPRASDDGSLATAEPTRHRLRVSCRSHLGDLDAIKEMASLPFILKGVATAEDAALAVEHGVSTIYVSNHGGRQLDHGRATIEMLPEIADAVRGRAEILLDGGVIRGSDVLKAIALGARAVAIGKLQGWGLAAAGQAGLLRVLEIMESEIVTTMGLLGITQLDQLTSAYLCKVQPLTPAHEMSAFPHMPGGQLL